MLTVSELATAYRPITENFGVTRWRVEIRSNLKFENLSGFRRRNVEMRMITKRTLAWMETKKPWLEVTEVWSDQDSYLANAVKLSLVVYHNTGFAKHRSRHLHGRHHGEWHGWSFIQGYPRDIRGSRIYTILLNDLLTFRNLDWTWGVLNSSNRIIMYVLCYGA